MNNIKTWLLAVTLLAAGMAGHAAGRLTVNGAEAELQVTEMTIVGSDASLTFADGTTATLPLYQLRFTPVADPTAIDGAGTLDFYVASRPAQDGRLEIGGATVGDAVRIFDLQGRLCQSARIEADPALLDISRLSRGIYVVLVGQRTAVKIQVR